MKQYLPGIVRIAFIGSGNVPANIELKAIAGIPVDVNEPITDVCFTGIPTCTTESVNDNHAQVEKTTLTFSSTDDVPIKQRIAFLILDANGQWWLIGHRESPFPVIRCTHHTGEADGEKAGYVYEVTLIGRKALIPVNYWSR